MILAGTERLADILGAREMDAAPLTEEESVPNSIDGALIDEGDIRAAIEDAGFATR